MGWDEWATNARGASFAARAGFLAALPLALPGSRLLFLSARRGDRLVGAVPLVVTRRWGHRWAYSLPFGTYGGPLVDSGEPEPARVRAELAHALGSWLAEGRVAGGEVVCGPGREADPAWATLADSIVSSTAHVVSLEGRSFDSYVAGLEKSTREELRRAPRRGVVVLEEPEALAAAHALYLAQARSWRGHRPYPLAFLAALVEHPSRFARLFVARSENELLCAILVLSSGDDSFIWWSGSSPAARRTVAYPYLMVEIVRVMGEEGRKRVSLGSSGGIAALERYKESVGARPETVWTYRLQPHAIGPAWRMVEWARALRRRR
jgi:GNAT acetyltransferase-like protein